MTTDRPLRCTHADRCPDCAARLRAAGVTTQGEIDVEWLARLEKFAEAVAESENDTAGTRAMARYALTGSLAGVVDEMRATPEAPHAED